MPPIKISWIRFPRTAPHSYTAAPVRVCAHCGARWLDEHVMTDDEVAAASPELLAVLVALEEQRVSPEMQGLTAAKVARHRASLSPPSA
jgi:hypothetical protein